MKKLGWSLATVIAIAFSVLSLGGQRVSAATPPDVTNLKPFTEAANFLSLPGYLRWQTFVQQGTWISPQVAITEVNDQLGVMVSSVPNPDPSTAFYEFD